MGALRSTFPSQILLYGDALDEDPGSRALLKALGLELSASKDLAATLRASLFASESDDLIDGVEAAVNKLVLQLRADTRRAAAEDASIGAASMVAVSNADDSERGSKAAAYVAKAIVETEAYALRNEDEILENLIDRISEACKDAIEDVACFEVFDAWNDETCRAAASLLEAGKEVTARWKTKRDAHVCPLCELLDRKAAGKDGKFRHPNSGKRIRPPLHYRCRCIVAIEAGKDLGEEESESMTYALQAASRSSNSVASHVKAIDAKARTVDFVASTDVIDSHDEIIDQGSWLLDDYLANPIVLYAHDSYDLPIGKAIEVAVRSANGRMQLETRIEFATEKQNPKAEQVFSLLQAKILRAVSVGFVPRSFRYELRDGNEVGVWSDCVLKEISVTPVPANPEALAKIKSLATKSPNPPAIPGAKPSGKTEEKIMDKETQDKLAADATTIAELRLSSKTFEERATEAETSVSTLAAQVKTLETEKLALDAQNKKLVEERDSANARAEKSEADLIEREVEALVGVKITPAEKPLFLDLRKSNADLFAKMVEQRSPLNLDRAVIAPTTESAAPNDVTSPNGASIKAINRIAELGK